MEKATLTGLAEQRMGSMSDKERRRHKGGAASPNDPERRRAAESMAHDELSLVPASLEPMSIDATRAMLHELHVHQIELEMQNDELRRTHMELEIERTRYFDLYDQAPVGYVTLSSEGLILQANLTAAALLAVPRTELLKQRISRFIHVEDQDAYYLMRQRLLHFEEPQSCELRMLRSDGALAWMQLAATLTRAEGSAPTLRVTLGDVTERRQDQEDLRIAATAFEAQEGILVTDANNVILRVNRAFTKTTGYSAHEVVGKTPAMLKSARNDKGFYAEMWKTLKSTGSWQGDLWNRRKSGEEFPEHLSITVVKDERGRVTHYVGYLVDATNSLLQEQQRLLNEAAHRDMLVREVHHRIKNNLQGILGILRKFANKHPETAEPMHHAISQVQTISVIHGLQGRRVASPVLLCELVRAIAREIEGLWQTPITLDMPAQWQAHVISEDESVPIALVLNELVLNAVKHGGQSHGGVGITIQAGQAPGAVQVRMVNQGQFAHDGNASALNRSGLHLISALMPSRGAHILREQRGRDVVTVLELEAPVISQNL